MLNELLAHPDYKGVMNDMRQSLTSEVMSEGTDHEARDEALRKYHLLDWLEAELARAAST